MATFAQGDKQKADKAAYKKRLNEEKESESFSGLKKSTAQMEHDRELKDREMFGDPLKLIQSKNIRFGGGATETSYRVLTT